MAQQWYVIHTYSGYENRAKQNLEERIKNLNKGDLFSEILVPTETVVELVKGKRKTSQRKIFPGYILVKMELNEETWHIVRETPKITGFAGDGTKPVPISETEVNDVLSQMKEGGVKAKPKVSFNVGDSVRVIDGPFANFIGTIEEGQARKAQAQGSRFHFRQGDTGGTRLHPGGEELAVAEQGADDGEKSGRHG